MWCPKCQNEYRSGITVCPECNTPLIEELEKPEANYVKVASVKDAELKDKIVKYLDHLSIPNRWECIEEVEGEAEYVISVSEEKANESLNVIGTVVKVEAEKQVEADSEKAMEEAKEALEELQKLRDQKGYIRADEKRSNYLASGELFIGLGSILAVVVVLSIAGIIPFLNSSFTLIVLGAIAIASFVSGTLNRKKGNSLKEEVEKENEDEEKFKSFLKENITKDILDSLNDDEITPELLYLKQSDYIKEALLKEYPDMNDEHADLLTDEFLSELYNDNDQD